MKLGSIFIEVEKNPSKQKYIEDNNADGQYSSQSHPSSNINSRKFVIKCAEMDNIEEQEIKKELEPQGIITVRRISERYSLYAMMIKGQDILEKNLCWILEKKKKDLTFTTLKDASNAWNLDTQNFAQRKASLCRMWWGRV